MTEPSPVSAPRPRWSSWILILPLIVVLGIGLAVAKQSRHDITLLSSTVSTVGSGQRIVTGSVRNDADEPLAQVQVDIDMLAADGALLATAYSSTGTVPPGTTWTFETPIPFENARRFRITKLSCRRDGETIVRLCAPNDTIEVGGGGS